MSQVGVGFHDAETTTNSVMVPKNRSTLPVPSQGSEVVDDVMVVGVREGGPKASIISLQLIHKVLQMTQEAIHCLTLSQMLWRGKIVVIHELLLSQHYADTCLPHNRHAAS